MRSPRSPRFPRSRDNGNEVITSFARIGFSLVIWAALVALTAPTSASAGETIEDHKHTDASASKTPQEEHALTRRTQTETAADAQAAAAVPGAPDDGGRWSRPVDWPVVGIHVALLPNGKVLAYDFSPTGPMAVGRRQHNLTLLADGTALATGGHSGSDYL
ncbi:MAG: hypothetical protein LC790_19285, partial [Actinobacteria bacterium]|nr:hypothetical protein [Actinomycetota bacterium]